MFCNYKGDNEVKFRSTNVALTYTHTHTHTQREREREFHLNKTICQIYA